MFTVCLLHGAFDLRPVLHDEGWVDSRSLVTGCSYAAMGFCIDSYDNIEPIIDRSDQKQKVAASRLSRCVGSVCLTVPFNNTGSFSQDLNTTPYRTLTEVDSCWTGINRK